MANPNFVATMSSNEIWRDLDDTRCITDDLDTIEADISALEQDKADVNHTHSGYAPTSHAHTEYAPSNHNHSYNDLSDKPTIPGEYTHPENHPASMVTGLATVATTGNYDDLNGKPTIPTIPTSLPANGGNADTVGGKQASDFAEANHTHNYAPQNHSHTEHSGDITIRKVNSPGITLQTTNETAVKSRIHKNSSATADYGTCISDYDANGKRDYLVLRRASPSVGGKLMLNIEDANGGATEMFQLYGEHNKPGVLWNTPMYMMDGQTVTPSKPLSECRTGWMLLWSDYDADTKTANDSEFVTTLIPRINPNGTAWSGKSFNCEIPRHIGSNPADVSTEKRIIKMIYVYNDRITGHAANNQGDRTDVVLRAVYEY